MPSAIVLQPLRRFVLPSSPPMRQRATLLLLLAAIFLACPQVTRTQGGSAPSQSQNAAKKQAKPAAPAPAATAGVAQEATLEAKQQRQVGRIYYADGDVDVRYQNTRLRADHVEYNEDTQVVIARGHVQLDYETQHVEAENARYEVNTGRGTFHQVRATFAVQRRPPAAPREVNAMQRQPAQTLLISPNPIYFEAQEAERLDMNTYRIRQAWMTVC